MISARKLAANRANARASTGPRTAAGKAHSARNAVRHGLCSWADPAIGRAIEEVGRRLAGEATGEERELVYAVAAAQVDLARARDAGRKVCAEPRVAAAPARSRFPPGTPAAEAPEEEPGPLEELLSDCVYQLEAIKRYEVRAFARRERAIRALDDRRTGAEPPPRRLPRPRGLRLPRWRLPNPDPRVIRFAGLPRWAWWRPDPLDAEPKKRRAPRRRRNTEVASELELLVSSALLARLRIGAPDDLGERCSGDAMPSEQLPVSVEERAGVKGADRAVGTPSPRPSPQRGEGDQPLAVVNQTGTSSGICADAIPAGGAAIDGSPAAEGVIEELRETKPPQAGAGESEQTPPVPDPPAPVSHGTTLTPQSSETKPWRRGATPTPLPTCRVGPCRWVGEMPADHWTYRGWRYRRPPAQAAGFGAPPQIDPMARRCPGSPRGRSRAPP